MKFHPAPFCIEDCAKDGEVYGPYEFLSEARAQAERFKAWVIVDAAGNLVCESPAPAHSDEAFVPH